MIPPAARRLPNRITGLLAGNLAAPMRQPGQLAASSLYELYELYVGGTMNVSSPRYGEKRAKR